ncbi:MAG: hypothetical protein M5E90_07420 [Asgard group archaeon]|nr:hypothetical protein [Asgard group archaeon]
MIRYYYHQGNPVAMDYLSLKETNIYHLLSTLEHGGNKFAIVETLTNNKMRK